MGRGRREPDAAAIALLRMIGHDARMVARGLAVATPPPSKG